MWRRGGGSRWGGAARRGGLPGAFRWGTAGGRAPAAAPAPEDALARVAELREQGLSLRDAVKQAAKETGLPKNELYDRAVGKHVEA